MLDQQDNVVYGSQFYLKKKNYKIGDSICHNTFTNESFLHDYKIQPCYFCMSTTTYWISHGFVMFSFNFSIFFIHSQMLLYFYDIPVPSIISPMKVRFPAQTDHFLFFPRPFPLDVGASFLTDSFDFPPLLLPLAAALAGFFDAFIMGLFSRSSLSSFCGSTADASPSPASSIICSSSAPPLRPFFGAARMA